MNTEDAAGLAAALIAVDPGGLGGVCIRSQPHPVRDQWLRLLRELLPTACPIRRVPCHIDDGRLLGGLDLAATLRTNRPVCQRGVLATVDGGIVVLAMAERVSAHTAACIANCMDTQEVRLAREGFDERFAARFGLVAFDEGCDDDALSPTLSDRVAVLLDFDGLRATIRLLSPYDAREVAAARELLPHVSLDEAVVRELCEAALSLGIASPRISLLAVRVAKAAAALAGRRRIQPADAIVAGRLVLAARATQLPGREPEADEATRPTQPDESRPPEAPSTERSAVEHPTPSPAEREDSPQSGADQSADVVLDAAMAALPPGPARAVVRAGHGFSAPLRQCRAFRPRVAIGRAGPTGRCPRCRAPGRRPAQYC